MYGLFFLNKNNINHLIFLFKTKNYIKEYKDIRIKDLNDITKINSLVREKINNCVIEHFSKPYKMYYREIPNNTFLTSTMKELNWNNTILKNPLVNLTGLDIEVNNILNIKTKRYDKHDHLWKPKN